MVYTNMMSWSLWAFAYLILFANTCHGFYFLGNYMYKHTYSVGEKMFARVNSLTSINTQVPFSYYSLPYCKPPEGIKTSEMNLGQFLLGDQTMNSPYRFKMNVNETVFLCSTGPLTADEVKLLKQRIDDQYQVNMFLDYLPVARFTMVNDFKLQWTGFSVGYSSNYINGDYYIINHLKFKVLIYHEGNGFDIVGFEVAPYSAKHNLNEISKLHMYENLQPVNFPLELENSQVIQEHETVAFTYEVEFVESDIKWPSRWDGYLQMGNDEFRYYSIINSMITMFFLAGIMLALYLRTVRRELTQLEELNKELPGWKLVVGDVFREPRCAKLLCVMVGDGIQITGMALSVMVFSALGLVSPVSRGTLLTSSIMLYIFFSVAAGYTSVRLWITIKANSEGWKSVSFYVSCFYPGINFIVLIYSNILLYSAKSTKAIPVSLFFILLATWFCISVPLTLIGGFIGTKAKMILYPAHINHIAREIPSLKYLSWLVVLGLGCLPFGTMLSELFFIISSIWFGRFYFGFGFMLTAFLTLILVCSIVSVILTYMRLRVEDWCWWWKAFFASGSVGVYVLIYLINFLVFDLRGLSGSISTAIYVGYSLIMAIGVMLATGTIGFLVSFYFVQCLYSFANKIDC